MPHTPFWTAYSWHGTFTSGCADYLWDCAQNIYAIELQPYLYFLRVDRVNVTEIFFFQWFEVRQQHQMLQLPGYLTVEFFLLWIFYIFDHLHLLGPIWRSQQTKLCFWKCLQNYHKWKGKKTKQNKNSHMQVGKKRDIMWSNAHIHVFFLN